MRRDDSQMLLPSSILCAKRTATMEYSELKDQDMKIKQIPKDPLLAEKSKTFKAKTKGKFLDHVAKHHQTHFSTDKRW